MGNIKKLIESLMPSFIIVLITLLAILLLFFGIAAGMFYATTTTFYEGIVDTIAAHKAGIILCRHINIAEALKYNATDIYLLMDEKHARAATVYKNKLLIIDYASPSHDFRNTLREILHCKIKYSSNVYVSCRIVYLNIEGLKFKAKDPIVDLLLRVGTSPMVSTVEEYPLTK